MGKIGDVLKIVIGIVFAYVVLLAGFGAIRDLVSSANASLPADMSNYPGGREFLLTAPWWMWFLPATAGIVLLIIVLKRRR